MINYKPVIELIASRVLRCILKSILTLYMYLISLVIMYQYPQTIIIQVNNKCSVLLYNIVVPCELYLIMYMYLRTIYLILYLSDCYHLLCPQKVTGPSYNKHCTTHIFPYRLSASIYP